MTLPKPKVNLSQKDEGVEKVPEQAVKAWSKAWNSLLKNSPSLKTI